MNTHDRQKRLMIDALNAFVGKETSIRSLGSLASSLSFLSSVLRENENPLSADIEEEVSTLEEVYGVALDRGWQELPPKERQLISAAVERILERLRVNQDESRLDESDLL